MKENTTFILGYLICAIYTLISFIAGEYYSSFLYYDKIEIYLLVIFSKVICAAFIISLIAVMAMPRYRQCSVVIIFITGLIMLPYSAVMLYGLLRRNAQLRFSSLEVWLGSTKNLVAKTWLPYPYKNRLIWGTSAFTVGVVAYCSRTDIYAQLIEPFIAPLGFIVMVKAFCLHNKLQIGLLDDNLLITPTFFSDTYIIPLTQCQLQPVENNQFEITVKNNKILLKKDKKISEYDFIKLVNMFKKTK